MIKGQVVDVTTDYEQLLYKFQERIEQQKKKYPITEREKIFVETIEELLKLLDITVRNL